MQLVGLSRSYFYYKPHPRDDRAERARIREIAEARVRFGMWRIHTLMRREGWLINHKKTHRIYCEEGLNLRRRRPRRRVAAAHRMERPDVSTINECWSMDFVADSLFNGRRIRALTVVEVVSKIFRTFDLVGSLGSRVLRDRVAVIGIHFLQQFHVHVLSGSPAR